MAPDTTTCLLVRHGHVEGITPPRFRGRTELPLTALGRRQAEALRDRIARQWSPTAIYTSPLGRCVDTGKIVGQPAQRVPQPVADLIDRDYGQWQGLSHVEVHERWPETFARWRDLPQTAVIPGGERLLDVTTRTLRALHAILHRHRGKTVVVVAHDSVNRALLLYALDWPLQRYGWIEQAPCTLNVLDYAGGKLRVLTLNETGHIVGV